MSLRPGIRRFAVIGLFVFLHSGCTQVPAPERSDERILVVVSVAPLAGLAAAVYAASEGLRVTVLERNVSGGQAGESSHIRNFLGFTWGIGGQDFAYRACEQAWLFGASMVFAQEVVELSRTPSGFCVRVAAASSCTNGS